MKNNTERSFVKSLLTWNKEANTRMMPWKGEIDPYKIWLSEIILQQTRVDQGLAYYNRFIAKFPTIESLANADETVVFKLWEGLGYYSRCKNLLATAKHIAHSLDGTFPMTYREILSLKGIGPYTAAAIGSFAFKLPHAAVDGNVYRVLSRYFGIATATDSKEGKELFFSLANKLLDKKDPGAYNQAIMDFGAIICKPRLPLCNDCICKMNCMAFREGTVQQLPVKEKLINRRYRWFHYLLLEFNDQIYVRKRGPGDIWENLFEFVLIETNNEIPTGEAETFIRSGTPLGTTRFDLLDISKNYRQILTHQTIQGQFIHLKLYTPVELTGYALVPKNTIGTLPFSKFTSNYLKDKNVSLNLFHAIENQHLAELITRI